MQSILFIFSGLPGTGKTTLAKEVARYFKATYLRLDTIEHGIGELCNYKVQGEGYRLAYRIAADNLLIGNYVVADCCNPWELTRNEWKEVATNNYSQCIDIEVICSDQKIHRNRIESRENDINGFILPDWNNVLRRNYDQWKRPVIRIDTARNSKEQSINELLDRIRNEIQES